MLRMLLADDDPVFLSKLERLLTQYAAQQQRKVWIDAYPRDDLSGFVLQSYDIAFLDIDFGDRRGAGIDLARRLRQKRNDAILIFVTNYVEYAPEGYELRAFRYLLKTDIDMKLEAYFSQAAEQFAAKREILPIQTGGEMRNLTVDEILYLESDKHTVRIYMLSSSAGPYSSTPVCRVLKKSSSRWVSCGSRKAFLSTCAISESFSAARLRWKAGKRFRSAKRTTGRSSGHTSCGKERRHGVHN